jgi:hypothetical protein
MLDRKSAIDLGRSFTRTSNRMAKTLRRSRSNGLPFSRKGSVTVVAAAAGIAGFYAVMRLIRRAPGEGTTFDVHPNEHGGWSVKSSEIFETRSQAVDVARRATAALRPQSALENPLGTPDSAVRS